MPAVTPATSEYETWAASGRVRSSARVSSNPHCGGELKAKKRAAVATYDQAGGHYREVVLAGFQNVADVLTALDADARTLRECVDASSSAKTVYDVTSKRYEAGGVSLLALLDAQRAYLTASLDQTRAIADRYSDSASLFQALGGGWWSGEAQQTDTTSSKAGSPP